MLWFLPNISDLRPPCNSHSLNPGPLDPTSSWAALRIQKIPEYPQKDQDLLLSVQGIPGNFQDFNWYLGEETNGGTMLFTYFPDLQWPQRDGSAMGQHDIVGFPNGSMMLHRVQPTDSGTYQVAVNINPAWIMRAKTEVQVAEKHKELPIIHLPVSAGIMAAIIIGSLSAGSLFICCIAHLLLTGGWRGQSHRMTPTEKPEARPNLNAGDQHIYEVMPSPTHLVSPLGGTASMNNTMVSPHLSPKAPWWLPWGFTVASGTLSPTARTRLCGMLPTFFFFFLRFYLFI
uniref:Immunoglobulin V-set domain-containing protein n=1 Tax=Canis lupus familiaris TaxID=9615 RepID=A0A8P0PRL2_CANLF